MKNIALTGATGFVGSHVVEDLLKQNIKLSLLTRRKNHLIKSFEKSGADIYNDNLTNKEVLKNFVKDADTVIHIAGATKQIRFEDYIKGNVDTTENLLSVLEKGQRFIYISSQAAAGPTIDGRPRTEDDPDEPLTYYGKSKLLAEEKVQEWGKNNDDNYVILRPCSVFGPRERDIFTYFKLASNGLIFILGTGEKQISIIYVKDLSDAIISTAQSNIKGKTYFTSNDAAVSWNEIASVIIDAIGKKPKLKLNVPEFLTYPIGYIADFTAHITGKAALLNRQKIIEMKQDSWICSNENLKTDLGWKQNTTFEQAIKETADWYKKEGWI